MSWYYAENGQRQGPISDGEFNALLKKNVITANTLVWEDGMPEWRPYGELAREAAPEPQVVEELPRSEEEGFETLLERANDRRGQLSVNGCIQRAWQLHRSHFLQSSSVTFLIYSMAALSQFLPGVGTILGPIAHGPLMGGLFWFYLQLIRSGEASISHAFDGFRRGFFHLVATAFISGIAVAACLAPAMAKLGLMDVVEKGSLPTLTPISVGLLILGALGATYFTVAWAFALPLIIDKGLGAREALLLSRKAATPNWWRLFLLLPAGGLLVILVAIFAVVAVFLLDFALKGLLPNAALVGLEAIVSILCFTGVFSLLPIFFSALMFAYEDLFGPKKPTESPVAPSAPGDLSVR